MKVFDSSALLALIFDEAGAAKAEALLDCDDNLVGAANLSEVLAELVDQGMSDAEVEAVLGGLAIRVEPLSAEQARAAGRLRRQTRSLGMSLGDRCCLALAQAQHGAVVVTADRAWKQLTGFASSSCADISAMAIRLQIASPADPLRCSGLVVLRGDARASRTHHRDP